MANKGGVQEGRQLLALGNTEGTGCSLREKQSLHPGSVHSPHSGVPSHSFSTNDKPSAFCYGSQNFNHVKTQIAQYPSMSTGPIGAWHWELLSQYSALKFLLSDPAPSFTEHSIRTSVCLRQPTAGKKPRHSPGVSSEDRHLS